MRDKAVRIDECRPEELGWVRAPHLDTFNGGKSYRQPDGKFFIFPPGRVPKLLLKNDVMGLPELMRKIADERGLLDK